MATLYVLRLEHGCWYVGTTAHYSQRIDAHLQGKGAAWTRVHKMTHVHTRRSIAGTGSHLRFMEDMVVKKMMLQHGVSAVRGGTYSSVRLSATQQESLVTELRHAENKCLRCGSSAHFVSRCGAARYLEDPAPAAISPQPPAQMPAPPPPSPGVVTPPGSYPPPPPAAEPVPEEPAAACWPPQQALLELWQVPSDRRGPPSAAAVLTSSTRKTPKVLYIQQRVRAISGMTVAQALKAVVAAGHGKSSRKYRVSDLRYDMRRGYLAIC